MQKNVNPSDVTRHDVALLAGVSEAVVSYSINGTGRAHRIPEKTVDRVRKAAQKLGYKANAWGRILKKRRSDLVAFVSQDLSDPNTASLIRILGATTRAKGYGLVLFDLGASLGLDAVDVSLADAVLLHASSLPVDEIKTDDGGRLFGKPLCVIGLDLSATAIPSVEIDNILGAELSIRHLLDRGADKIGVIADCEAFNYTRSRMAGCANVLKGAPSRKLTAYYRREGDDQFQAGVNAVEKWLRSDELPDSIFAFGDVIALGALSVLHRSGVRCPEDVRIVGFDDVSFAEYASPSLTTIAQPFGEMCEVAVGMLSAMLDGGELRQVHHLAAPELRVRRSSGL